MWMLGRTVISRSLVYNSPVDNRTKAVRISRDSNGHAAIYDEMQPTCLPIRERFYISRAQNRGAAKREPAREETRNGLHI